MMPLLGTSPEHRYWLCTDSCGLTCATITWTLHIFAWSTTTEFVLSPPAVIEGGEARVETGRLLHVAKTNMPALSAKGLS